MKNITTLISIIIILSCQNKESKIKFNYEIITSDVENFWIAYDKLEEGKDSIDILQREFLNKASDEFKVYLERPSYTAKNYLKSIKNHPRFWSSVRKSSKKINNIKKEVDELYINFSKLFPSFEAPNICFGITPISSGGTAEKGLLLIGTEVVVVDTTEVDISEITGFFKNVFEKNNGDLLKLIAHELIHTQQFLDSLNEESILELAIIEGGADFLGEKILGRRTISDATYNYGEFNEEELWKKMHKDILAGKKRSSTDWFYVYDSPDIPADLGYYLGYKICESYYDEAENKKQAIEEILLVKNFNEFFKKSKYEEKKR